MPLAPPRGPLPLVVQKSAPYARSGYAYVSTEKRSANKATDCSDPIMRVSREAKGEACSLTGRAVRVTGNDSKGSEVEDGALKTKVEVVYPMEG